MDYGELKQKIESRDKGICMSINDGMKCPVCNGTGWEWLPGDTKTVRPCTACNGYHARKVSDALIAAGIPEGRTLSDFDWTLYHTDLTRQKRIISQFVGRFTDFEKKSLGLFIASKTRGSGKTLLASAIGGELIRRYEASIKLVSASDLIEISREKRDDRNSSLDDLLSCRILILDDLGQKLTGRDWLTDVLFRIIDKRYQAKKTIIVTSNASLSELDFDDRIVDRLNAMTITVRIPEECIRAKDAMARKAAFLKELGIE